jgi:hypothetical protein
MLYVCIDGIRSARKAVIFNATLDMVMQLKLAYFMERALSCNGWEYIKQRERFCTNKVTPGVP